MYVYMYLLSANKCLLFDKSHAYLHDCDIWGVGGGGGD